MKQRKVFARVKRTTPPGGMNKTETAYAAQLDFQKHRGEIEAYWYEGIKLKVNTACFYTPDFMVVTPEEIQMHEVKGQRREAGMVRLRTAAHQHRWARFFLVTKTRGNWVIEEVA